MRTCRAARRLAAKLRRSRRRLARPAPTLHLAAALEDEEITRKLELRK